MIHSIEQFNRASITALRGIFTSLKPPQDMELSGLYRGAFVGPGWLRRLGGPLLAVTGLGGWWGKEFLPDGEVINLVLRAGRYERRFPMFLAAQNSYIDGRPAMLLRYESSNPFPWPIIVDELRQVEEGTFLGMTLAALSPLRRIALPFVLQYREQLDGL